jgi:hypothetical protein
MPGRGKGRDTAKVNAWQIVTHTHTHTQRLNEKEIVFIYASMRHSTLH